LQFEAEINGTLRQIVVHRLDGGFLVEVDGRPFYVDAERIGPHTLSLLFSGSGSAGAGGSSHEVTVTPAVSGHVDVHAGGPPVTVSLNGRRRWRRRDAGTHTDGVDRIVAPMPGKVVRIPVQVGQTVAPRQPLVVMEAMKMENELRAGRAGIVAEVHVREGQSVDAGALLVVIAEEKP
jgi:biotin carboxyl carrier protein